MMKWIAGFWVVILGVSSGVIAADGFGQYTTGGNGGTIVAVNNAADLEYYAEVSTDPYIILISGTLDIGSSIEIRSNKTLRGAAPGATLIGQLGFRNRDSNIILERLNITNPYDYGEGDGVSIKQEITNVFITKCTFYDCSDGCLDISNKSDLITVSWCKFYYTSDSGHNFSNLIGSSDSQTGDRDKLRVTMHHNWWTTLCKERMPRVRYGQVHVYNNYYSDLLSGGYCVGVGVESHLRVENNYFDRVSMPWKDYYSSTSYPAGEIGWNGGNVFFDCSVPTWAVNQYETIFTPPYSYTPDDATMIPYIVQYGAGADGKDGYPPHWLFSVYGDFDCNGVVDMHDFSTFGRYWQATADIQNADIVEDGIVDSSELALFAEQWMQIPADETAPAAPQEVWAAGTDSQAIVSWAENSEPDLEGYYVYRSTTWGTGYLRLNDTPLKSTAFTDTGLVNGTVYYYAVQAVDTSGNESILSAEGCARPAIGSVSVTLQENAFGFCSVDGIVDSGKHAGFTGAGFCDTTNSTGSGILWRINLTAAGTYTFQWRYANGSSDRPGRLLVNGTELIAAISFPATGAWNVWDEVSVSVPLSIGVQSLRLEATTSGGLTNIDFLRISGDPFEPAGCPQLDAAPSIRR